MRPFKTKIFSNSFDSCCCFFIFLNLNQKGRTRIVKCPFFSRYTSDAGYHSNVQVAFISFFNPFFLLFLLVFFFKQTKTKQKGLEIRVSAHHMIYSIIFAAAKSEFIFYRLNESSFSLSLERKKKVAFFSASFLNPPFVFSTR